MSDNEFHLTRRQFMAGGATVIGALPIMDIAAEAAKIEQLEKEGFTKKPISCFICGAGCGLYAMTKPGEQPGEQSTFVVPNPTHPQRGMCGRAASTMWFWNHPLRLKKPLRRVGARGEGRFEPVEWNVALDEIAAKLKSVVEKDGEKAVALTAHDLTSVAQCFGYALGTPNIVNHAATCNTSGVVARRWIFEAPYNAQNKVDPDYENARYVLLIGRTLQASMGAQARLAQGKAKGATVVFVDPRMPEPALGGAEWVPITPGTDTAFALALAQVMLAEKLYDADFLRKGTNLPMLLKEDGLPLTQADLKPKGDATLYMVWDPKKNAVSPFGVKRGDDGKAVELIAEADVEAQLDYAGEVALADRSRAKVTTAFNRFVERCAGYPAAEAAKITGVPAATITRIAREFAAAKGVCDDSWYNARNGNDFDAVRAMVILNALVGNIDKPGGLCFQGSAGVGGLISLDGKTGDVKNVLGRTWQIAETKRIDTATYGESNGTFDAVYKAILEGKPYPVKALWTVGTTLFWRDANTERVRKALAALDLLVVQDILPHEVCDWADYVLPASFFIERPEVAQTKWTMHVAIQVSEPVLPAPQGCDARDDLWMLMEVLRRAYPDRAERFGWTAECADPRRYRETVARQIEQKALGAALKRLAEKDPEAPAKVRHELEHQGYAVVAKKKYKVQPYVKPLETPSGRMEVYALRGVLVEKLRGRIDPLPQYQPVVAYKLPAAPDEFYLVSGKNPANSSGTGAFAYTGKSAGDRSVWIHPADAERLRLKDGQLVQLEGLDTGARGQARLKVTRRIKPGVLFAFAFSGGFRGKLGADKAYAHMQEGINTHWFAKGHAEPIVGAMANNASVRISAATAA